jgi:hypothetical protein
MTTRKPPKGLADYVTVALSPVLIMALVGSLVFFLLEILYVGEYSGALQWTLFFFVFASVLIARIAIENGDGRAWLYAFGLAVAVWLALRAYVEYGPDNPAKEYSALLNAGLMAVIWWCAHRLTWDCTYIDDHVDASGMGVLEAAGLDEEAQRPGLPSADGARETLNHAGPGFLAWWRRYRAYRKQQLTKPHTPGVWVVYFSLAALPIFGLGQSLVPVDQQDRRHYVFWLMVVYVASGLGLLMTTSFLGLRRYLRQRKMRMPLAMTRIWMVLGGGLIVALMLLGALLPRPYGEYQVVRLVPVGSHEREASRFAMRNASAGKGEGRPGGESQRDPQVQPGSGTKSENQRQTRSTSDGRQSGGNDSGSRSGQGSSQGRDSSGRSRSQDSAKIPSSGDRDPQRDKTEVGDQKSDDRDSQRQNAGGANRTESDKARTQGSAGNRSSAQGQASRSNSSGAQKFFPKHSLTSFFPKLGWLATLLKWVVFGSLILVVGFFVLRAALRFLANFTNWAKALLNALRAWWQGLFGPCQAKGTAQSDAPAEEIIFRPPPFSAFRNPFADGSSGRLSPERLVRYSFEALQAWAWENRLDRHPQETPLEFAGRLAGDVPALDPEVNQLAGLYVRVAYARGKLGPASLQQLEQFWGRLEAVHERPLSA